MSAPANTWWKLQRRKTFLLWSYLSGRATGAGGWWQTWQSQETFLLLPVIVWAWPRGWHGLEIRSWRDQRPTALERLTILSDVLVVCLTGFCHTSPSCLAPLSFWLALIPVHLSGTDHRPSDWKLVPPTWHHSQSVTNHSDEYKQRKDSSNGICGEENWHGQIVMIPNIDNSRDGDGEENDDDWWWEMRIFASHNELIKQ